MPSGDRDYRDSKVWRKVVETNAPFRPASTGFDHALVACDLTRILTVSLVDPLLQALIMHWWPVT